MAYSRPLLPPRRFTLPPLPAQEPRGHPTISGVKPTPIPRGTGRVLPPRPPYKPPHPLELVVQGRAYPAREVRGAGTERRMEKYENLGLVGEGSYGMVLKCKHKETGQFVAIKKFLESEDDRMVKKIAMREVRMLKQLRHENLVNLIEVFRRKKRLYLVFEFVDHTVLDDLERCPNGLDETVVRRVLWQVVRGVEFCHLHNIIHRDIKPENILVSKTGIVKLCDFGFARTLAQPGEAYTDYVATRWYRAPELLVGDTKYGRAVDIWAVGCLASEMLTGDPLFPGDSDIDQLFHIVKCFGNLTPRHREIFHKNPLFVGMRLPEVRETVSLEKKFPRISALTLGLIKICLRLDADDRPTCSQLLRHEFFAKDGFAQRFAQEIKSRIHRETNDNPLLRNQPRAPLANRPSKENLTVESNKESKENEGKRKKKEKEKKDTREEDKPKRRLPDPQKFKKPSPVAAMYGSSTHGLTPRLNHSGGSGQEGSSNQQQTPSGHQQPTTGNLQTTTHSRGIPTIHNPSNQSPTTSHSPKGSPANCASVKTLSVSSTAFKSPPLHGGPTPLRTIDKVKKGTLAYSKKNAAPSHHSTTLSPQPLQAAYYEKYDKFTNTRKRTVAEPLKVDKKDKDGLSLPEVKGAEANPNKSGTTKAKKGQVPTMPHITNLDPFGDSSLSSSHLPDKDSNLPMV